MKTYLITNFGSEIKTEEPIFNTFKQRAAQVKEMFNYKFPTYIEPRVIDLGVCYIEFDRL
jgi:hypothetical protein